MSDVVVCDASALVALLIDDGPDGRWATGALSGAQLVAPHLMAFEVANILRRHAVASRIGADQAAQAHADLLDLTIERWPYELLADRAWELRPNLTIYDASYVALAEIVAGSLVTLDRGIRGAPGVRCEVLCPG